MIAAARVGLSTVALVELVEPAGQLPAVLELHHQIRLQPVMLPPERRGVGCPGEGDLMMDRQYLMIDLCTALRAVGIDAKGLIG